MSGLLFENKHAIAKVRENANKHGGKNATITKWRHWLQLLSENEKNIQNIKYKSTVQKHRSLWNTISHYHTNKFYFPLLKADFKNIMTF